MVDSEGVPRVPWNPSLEGLPSKILCAKVVRTLRSHWSYALQLPVAILNACVNYLYQKFDARMGVYIA